MDEQPQQPTAPQIRSRITVVCAECKRLKLKCDRRTPCGSCTKRDTVSRCIYSPAAAEKVDLHSLNNRLIQVEATLAMLTAGKNPPPFQSSYPLAQVAPVSTQSSKARPSHTATSSTTSGISIRMDDLVNIWLAHCQLDIFTPVKAELPHDSNSFVKLEPSQEDLVHLATPYPENTIMIDDSPLANTGIMPVTQHKLPSLHIYYSTSAATQQQEAQGSNCSHPTHTASFNPERNFELPTASQDASNTLPSASQSPVGRPTASQALFAHLPLPAARTKLLASAKAANPHLSLLMHWSRVVHLADPTAKRESDRKSALAQAVFFGIRPESSSSSLNSTSSATLPLFACLCYSLALGALERTQDATFDHAYLYALAGQAIGVWEEYQVLPATKEAEEGSGDARAKQIEMEKEQMDHLVASLLQIKYLLRVRASASSKDITSMMELAFPLIGKLVNTARGLGLAKDPEEDGTLGYRRAPKVEERRRMIWWDIMFYDSFTSDALDHTPLVSLNTYSTKLPNVAQSSPQRTSAQYPLPSSDDADAGDSSDLSGDNVDTDVVAEKPTLVRLNTLAKGNIRSRLIPLVHSKGKEKALPSRQDDAEFGFFGVRCRLTHLAQTLKHRFAYPGCDCCTCGSGYNLDQAVKLEAEIRAWATDLPPFLRLDSPTTSSPSMECRNDVTKSPRHAAIAAELAIIANRMIISAYLPIMRPPPELAGSSSACISAYSAAHPWSPASRATIDAAQCVVRAARVLHRLMQSGMSGPLLMGEYYPLDKAVVDALVICGHSGFATGKPGRPIMEEVVVALEVLNAMGRCEGELERVVASLRRRVEASEAAKLRSNSPNSLKRKHHALEYAPVQEVQRVETCPRSEESAMSIDLEHPYATFEEEHNHMMPTPQHPPPQQQHHPIPSPPSSQKTSSSPRSRSSDKKQGKKGPTSYPSVGFRDRGKEGAPWMAKKVDLATVKRDIQKGPLPEPKLPEKASSTEGADLNFHSANTHQQIPPSAVNQILQLEAGYRSRSSSVTQPPRMPTADYPVQFGVAENQNSDLRANQRRRFSIHDPTPIQTQQPELAQPFAVSPTNVYNASQHSSRASSFDAPHRYDHRRSFDQTAGVNAESMYGPSSPYTTTSTPRSSASSPYGSTHGHPLTPTSFGSTSHRPSPPTFGPQPSVSNQNYFHMTQGYDASYDQQQQTQVISALSMDTSMIVQNQATADPMSSVPSTPNYEKTHQQAMYEVKAPVDVVQQQQQQALHNFQVTSRRGTPVDTLQHMSLGTPIHQTWAPTPQYMQPQQPMTEQHDAQQYWNTDAYYR